MDAIRTLGWRTEGSRSRHPPRSPCPSMQQAKAISRSEQGVHRSALHETHQAPFGCRPQQSPLRVGERPTATPNGRCRAGRDHSPTAQIRATSEQISPLCEAFLPADLKVKNTPELLVYLWS